MVHYHDILQGSDEWFELKKDKLSASIATAIGANGPGLKTECKKIAMRVIGIVSEDYTNSDMERGNDLEEFGRIAYEMHTGYTVKEIGFVTNDKHLEAGCSPDGLIDNPGLTEIKARNDQNHFSLLIGERGAKLVPSNQMQFQLMITGREWCDFVSYNPNFKKSLFIERHFPDVKYQEKLIEGLEEGRKLIKKYIEIYSKY